jgi:hypothetical protein
MRRYSIGALVLCGVAFLHLGCTTTRVVRVEVPVPVPCQVPTVPPRPVLPELKATDTPGERAGKKAEAFGETLGWGLHLEALLRGMAAAPTPTPGPGK